MMHIQPRQMVAFVDELTKVALSEEKITQAMYETARRATKRGMHPGFILRRLVGKSKDDPVIRRLGKTMATLQKGLVRTKMLEKAREISKQAGYGGALALGAGLGAGVNLLRHRGEEGQLGHAVKGALGGAAVTGAGILSTKAGRDAAMNVLRRERYHLTGSGLGSTPEARAEAAQKIGLIPKARGWALGAKPDPESLRHLEAGYQSAPGVAHNLLTNPKEMLRHGWERGGAVGKVMTGLGAVQAAKGFAQKPEEGGPGRLERGLSGVGQMVGGMVAPPGLIASGLVSGGLSRVGKTIGRAGDRLLGRGRVVPQQEYADYGSSVGANG